MPDRKTLVALVAILVVATLIRIPFFGLGLLSDEVVYGMAASAWLDGGLPYQDVWDHKPPGIYLTYAAAFAVSGESAVAVRVVTTLFTLATVVVVFFFGRRLFGKTGGLAAAMAFALFSGSQIVGGVRSNTEVFMTLPLTGAMLAALVAVERRSVPFALAAGLLGGVAFSFKAVAVFTLLAVPLYAIWSIRYMAPGERKTLVPLALAFGAGLAAAPAALAAYFATQGGFGELFSQAIVANIPYLNRAAAGGSGWGPITALALVLLALLPLWLAGGAQVIMMARSWRAQHVFLALALVLSTVGALAGLRGFGHYFIQPLPYLALAVGAVVAAAGTTTASIRLPLLPLGRNRLSAMSVILVLAAVTLVVPVVGETLYYLARPPAATDVRIEEVVRYVEDHSNDDDHIFVWGSEPSIYLESGRRSPTRYVSSWSARLKGAGSTARDEILADLRRERPTLIVVIDSTEDFPALAALLTSDYRQAATLAIQEPVSLVTLGRGYLSGESLDLYTSRPVTVFHLK